MELEFKRTVYKINIYGKSYEMRRPTVREIIGFQTSVKDNSNHEESIERLTEFFVSLGLDKEVINDLEIDHMTQIAETIISANKKK
jgi:alcohol dehydrogenase YqhD (iron-dependent ADH family)